MKEVQQFASPVFKKRFARRTTTQRPFTFARNFEAEETSVQNQIIEQVGDRGIIITSTARVPKDNGLSITDIVRQSPVPVLIAHSSPKNISSEVTNCSDVTKQDASSCRRSDRSRVPSERFLVRQQYPLRMPQHRNLQHTPVECHIGSQNSNNIDEEVRFDGDGKGKRAKPSRSNKNASTLETDAIKTSVIKESNTTSRSSRKEKNSIEMTAVIKNPSSHPVESVDQKKSNSKAEKAAYAARKEQTSLRDKDGLPFSSSGAELRSHNVSMLDTNNSAVLRSQSVYTLDTTNSTISETALDQIPTSTKSKKSLTANTSQKRGDSSRLASGKSSTGRNTRSNAKRNIDGASLDSHLTSCSVSERRKRGRVQDNDDKSSAFEPPSGKKRKTVQSENISASVGLRVPKSKEQQLKVPATPPSKTSKTKRISTIVQKSKEDTAVRMVSSKPRTKRLALEKLRSLPKHCSPELGKGPQNLRVQKVSRNEAPRTSNSSRKISGRISDERQVQKKRTVYSSSAPDENTFSGQESENRIMAKKVRTSKASSASQHQPQQDQGDSSSCSTRPRRKKKVVTELDVIIKELSDIESNITESSEMSVVCRGAVQKAFSLVRKHLLQTIFRVTEIMDMTTQINKLKMQCKIMSNETKDNHNKKHLLMKELQSLQDSGLEAADICRINEWLHDFQAFRQTSV